MPYPYVREPLTQEDADNLSNACETIQEKLIVWPLLDCGLRVSELCSLTPKHIQWQQRSLRIKGKGGPYVTETGGKPRVVPMSPRVRAIFACTYLAKGGSLALLKKNLGHGRLTTTEIYLNLTDQHIVEEYERKW